MFLVDTAVWIDHFRAGEPRLQVLLEEGRVLVHPFVIGELACGNLRNRSEILGLLRDLPGVPRALDDEVLDFIERHELAGRGIGYVDAHLLAASALAAPARLWARDGALRRAGRALGLVEEPG